MYVDDMLVASKSVEDHERHLRAVLQRLNDIGVQLNVDKCVVGVPELDFLRHHLSSAGVAPTAKKAAEVRTFTEPATQAQLRRVIGMITFYHRLIPHASQLLAPLHALIDTRTKRSQKPVTWTPDAREAFSRARRVLSDIVRLAFPVAGAPLSVQIDASATGIGAVLQQYVNGIWRPLSFHSRQLTPTERRYSTFGRELLAAYSAVRHFRHTLEGRTFTLFTDHKPLTSAIGSGADTYSPRGCATWITSRSLSRTSGMSRVRRTQWPTPSHAPSVCWLFRRRRSMISQRWPTHRKRTLTRYS